MSTGKWRSRMRRMICLAWLVSAGVSWPEKAPGQQVKPSFYIHLETLPVRQQEDMRAFSRKLSDYVEGWDWLDEDLPDPVPFRMEAFLAYMGSVVKTRYGSKLTVSNGLDIKYLDRWWFFEFEQDDLLKHDDRQFHPLTWLIDYYTRLMIGHELDKYGEFAGDEHFRKAQRIAMDARFSQDYQKGWDERLIVVEGILADEYKPYRRLRWLFYQGMNLQRQKNDKEARGVCRQVVDLLASLYAKNARDERLKEFFAAHYLELADVFKTDATPEVYQILLRIDPDHKTTYTEYMNNSGK